MTQVKVCGVTRAEDLRAALAAGADAIGFNFVPGTPRALADAQAAELSRECCGRALRVGVFRDAPRERVLELVESVGLDVVQLHGSESPEYAASLPVPVIKSLPADADLLARAAAYPKADLIVDHPSGGGTGKTWDYTRALSLVQAGRRVWIGGGLTPQSVSAAIAAAHPHGVDACSGLERAPGVKDDQRVREFVRAAREQSASASTSPTAEGMFGRFGGRYVPETLVPAVTELTNTYEALRADPRFIDELAEARGDYVGRPTPLTFASRLSAELGLRVYLKREDLAHTGSHKINNAIGQALIARRMGKPRVIAETGAGQHGVATATACARYGLACEVYMGEEDTRRQALNVFRMELLGAKVHPVKSGSRTLKDAMNEALRDWSATVRNTYYLIGSTAGPHPYPLIVRDLQSVIGLEAREQIQRAEGRLPDLLVACVGGGSNSMGIFHPFRDDAGVAMLAAEAGGDGIHTARHGASITKGSPGVLHGSHSYVLQDDDGQIFEAHSISAGLDYPGIGPEHSFYKDAGRAEYTPITDKAALDAFCHLSRAEGIIPAFESAHAIAALIERAPKLAPGSIVVVNLSGRGDKDVQQARVLLGRDA